MYRVLIADDEKAIRNGMQVLVDWEALGFEVVALAENGLAARKLVDEKAVDVVITDVRMPGMDGLTLSKELRQSGREKEVIIISGYNDFEYARKAIEYGVRNYLLKPLDPEQLTETLTRIKRERDERLGPLTLPDEGEVVSRMKQLISQKCDQPLSLATLSEEFNYNPAYLGRVFKERTGKSFRSYLNFCRVQRAARLLKESRHKVHEISEMVGYKDLNYFSRAFKEIYQVSPGLYRRKNSVDR